MTAPRDHLDIPRLRETFRHVTEPVEDDGAAAYLAWRDAAGDIFDAVPALLDAAEQADDLRTRLAYVQRHWKRMTEERNRLAGQRDAVLALHRTMAASPLEAVRAYGADLARALGES